MCSSVHVCTAVRIHSQNWRFFLMNSNLDKRPNFESKIHITMEVPWFVPWNITSFSQNRPFFTHLSKAYSVPNRTEKVQNFQEQNKINPCQFTHTKPNWSFLKIKINLCQFTHTKPNLLDYYTTSSMRLRRSRQGTRSKSKLVSYLLCRLRAEKPRGKRAVLDGVPAWAKMKRREGRAGVSKDGEERMDDVSDRARMERRGDDGQRRRDEIVEKSLKR